MTPADSLLRGLTADVWLVEDGRGRRCVATFAYEPARDRAGRVSVILPSLPGQHHPSPC